MELNEKKLGLLNEQLAAELLYRMLHFNFFIESKENLILLKRSVEVMASLEFSSISSKDAIPLSQLFIESYDLNLNLKGKIYQQFMQHLHSIKKILQNHKASSTWELLCTYLAQKHKKKTQFLSLLRNDFV